jgi:tripeptidyl-peptidase-1
MVPQLALLLCTALGASTSWVSVGRSSPDDQLSFRIALKQRNLNVLEETFWNVSNPEHERYGQFLTRDEVLRLVAPSPEEVSAVTRWLANANISRINNRGDVLEIVQASASQVEALFVGESVVLHRFKYQGGGEGLLRLVGELRLPVEIQSVVESFLGLEDKPFIIRRRGVLVGADDASHPYTFPYTLRKLYGIDAVNDRISTPKATQAVAAFDSIVGKQAFDPSELADFYTGTGEFATVVTKISGPNSGHSPEGNLDVQYLGSMGSGGALQFWATGGTFVDQANDIFSESDSDRPLVYSVSYGIDEHQYRSYIARCDTEYMKLGTVGVSVLVASGDDGANGDEACLGTYPLMGGGYPSTSPYVTSVGATQQDHNATHQSSATTAPICSQITYCADGTTQPPTPEMACSHGTGSLITTGGGFSFFAAQPDYQKAAVSAYLKSGTALPSCGADCFTATNRAYPDVSANGDYFLLRFPYNGKQWCSSAGTSCSTPVFAGIISLLNGKRLTANKAPLGFLNPLLYTAAVQHPTVFTDITVGDNTYSRLSHCKYGFKCAKGWDPVTGLGTPNFPEIVKYLTTVDSKHFYDTERWVNS